MIKRPSDLTAADSRVARRPFGEFEEVEPLLVLCAKGKLYEVERWIEEGRPIQFPPPGDRKLQRRATALQIAVGQGFHSLAALLLANGYDPNGDYYECLSRAVHAKDHDLVELLLRFGADPQAIDFYDVLETRDRALMARFIEAGVDPCRENAVARALGLKGRPILGFVKEYRERFPCLQRQIDIALRVATEAQNLRSISFQLWLGGDPHAQVPASAYDDGYSTIGETAFESAIWSRNPEVLRLLLKHPLPGERLDELLIHASYRASPDLVRRLLDEGANPNAVTEEGAPALKGFVSSLLWRHHQVSTEEYSRGFSCLEIVLKAGAKLTMDACDLKGLRRDLADGESKIVVRILDLLRQYEAISPDQFHELTRTPAVRKVLNGISKTRRDPFGVFLAPAPPAPAAEVARKPVAGYWKSHWSQR